MKEELEKLGFEYNHPWKRYKLSINDKCLYVIINNEVILAQNTDQIIMFKYNHEKLKQLIQILS